MAEAVVGCCDDSPDWPDRQQEEFFALSILNRFSFLKNSRVFFFGCLGGFFFFDVLKKKMPIDASSKRLRMATEQLILLFANPHLGPIIIRFLETQGAVGQGMEQLTTLSRTIASLLGKLEHLIPAVFQGLITDAVDKCPTPELLFVCLFVCL